MNQFQLSLSTDNAAFQGDDMRAEIARILRELAETIDNGSTYKGGLYDANGNRVGSWNLSDNEGWLP